MRQHAGSRLRPCRVLESKPWISANILTLNPGWDQNPRARATSTDVRELQRQLKAHGVHLVIQADDGTTGPASFLAVDPDVNQNLVDQHV